MARFDLSDAEWSIIVKLLPNCSRGVAHVRALAVRSPRSTALIDTSII